MSRFVWAQLQDTISVTADAAQLKTESAEQSTIIQTDRINALPLNFGGGGGSTGSMRSPFAFNMLSPAYSNMDQTHDHQWSASGDLPCRAYRIRRANPCELDLDEIPRPVDLIEEILAAKTSTFAAEFQPGGRRTVIIYAIKTGTNQFHGVPENSHQTNEALDGYRPYFTSTVYLTNPCYRERTISRTISTCVDSGGDNGRNKTFSFSRRDHRGTSPTRPITGRQ